MGFRDRIKQKVQRYAPEDRPALVRFQREMFGADAPQLDDRYFTWLFDRNPFNDETGPQLWVYPDGDDIVGLQAGIPFELKAQDSSLRASWAVDLMVHPKFRLRGVGPVLNEVYTDSNDVSVGIGLTGEAYQSFKTAGWSDLGHVPLYVRPMNAPLMVGARGNGSGLRRAAAQAARPGMKLADLAGDLYAFCRGAELIPMDRFDERVDAVWEGASGAYPVIARRDHVSLGWRFDALPNPARYERFYFVHRKTIRGYVVLRIGRHHNAAAGFIVDFLCGSPWMTPLFACCLRHFRRVGVAAVYCTAMHPEAGRRLHPLGFLRRESGSHIMLRPGDDQRPLPNAVFDPQSWFLTSGDSDADRPMSASELATPGGAPVAR